MAYSTSNKTVTSTYTNMTAATSGEAIFQNRSGGAVRVAMAGSTPADTILGIVLQPGEAFSRGAGTGNIYARTDRDDSNDLICAITEDS